MQWKSCKSNTKLKGASHLNLFMEQEDKGPKIKYLLPRARLPYFFVLAIINQILGPVSCLRGENRFYLKTKTSLSKFFTSGFETSALSQKKTDGSLKKVRHPTQGWILFSINKQVNRTAL